MIICGSNIDFGRLEEIRYMNEIWSENKGFTLVDELASVKKILIELESQDLENIKWNKVKNGKYLLEYNKNIEHKVD